MDNQSQLTGKQVELSELIYFKLHKSQIPVVEQAIETAGLMLGKDKSRGYCVEMICADFLARANLDGRQKFVSRRSERRIVTSFTKNRPVRLNRSEYSELQRVYFAAGRMAMKLCGTHSNLEVHHQQFRSRSGSDAEDNLITLCHSCHAAQHQSLNY